MKKFRDSEAIELVEKTLATEEAERCEKYLPPLDDFTDHAGWLVDGVRAGIFLTCEILRDGEAVACLFYCIGPLKDKTLIVTAVHSLTKNDVSTIIHAASVKLAKLKGCSAIEFVTRRPEMAKKSALLGYRAIGVVMRLKT